MYNISCISKIGISSFPLNNSSSLPGGMIPTVKILGKLDEFDYLIYEYQYQRPLNKMIPPKYL
ncbi:MAG: hypothetical protein E6L04_04375 [Thaumarchaeota archaeon]|nr:MAG: hypothetical protein E6L04_04375 [Nitrososphaerota archaeon]